MEILQWADATQDHKPPEIFWVEVPAHGSQLFDAVLCFFDAIAVKESYPQPRKRGRHFSSKFFNKWRYLFSGTAHQIRSYLRLNAIELVVNRGD